MKRARLSALVRPLVLVGAVMTACNMPSAPSGATSSTRPTTTAAQRTPRNFRQWIPSKAGASGTSRPASAGTGPSVFGPPKLTYDGGPVISNVHVVAVDWTSSVDPMVVSLLPVFFQTIVTGPYFTWLQEYNTPAAPAGTGQTIGLGTVDTGGSGAYGTWVLTPAVSTGTTLSDADIQVELSYQLTNGLLPTPLLDSSGNVNSLYVIDFPPGYTITDPLGDTLCASGAFAYHYTFEWPPSFEYVPYAIMLDYSTAGCSGATTSLGFASYLQTSTFAHSHELVEAVTDEAIGIYDSGECSGCTAWYDSSGMGGGESADLCEPGFGTVETYTVATIWSNSYAACIAVAPDCDSTTPKGDYCTPCTLTGAPACTSPTSVCDAKNGSCVGCLKPSDCSTPTAICDKSNDMCRGCKPSDCKGTPTPVCETSGPEAGGCVECDGTNSSACTGATPTCDTLSFTCIGCIDNSSCSGTTPICGMGQTCGPCRTDVDCSPQVCEVSTGACVQCVRNSDCGSETCGPDHKCICTKDSQCANPAPICSSAGTCEGCKTSGDCAGSSSGGACAKGSCVECVMPSDCPADKPVCDTKAHRCKAGAGADAGTDAGPPPADAGSKGSDAGGKVESSGGCSAAANGPAGSADPAILVLAGLGLAGARRRRRSPV